MQDLKDFGFNQATVSTLSCIVLTLIGAYGQTHQIKKIWGKRKSDRVSGLMTMVMFTLFASYLVRGIAEQRIMYLFQGSVRTIFVIAIVIGVIRFGDSTKNNLIWLLIGLGVLTVMSVCESWRLLIFSGVLYAGIVGAAHQAWSVRNANGHVSFVNCGTSLASVSFQGWYAWYYKDTALLIPCLGFFIVYVITLILMVKNRRK